MKRDSIERLRRNRKGCIGMKRLIAVILALAMALAMLCATAEDSDGILLPDDSMQGIAGEWSVGDEVAVDDSDMDLEFKDGAIPDEDALAIDEVSLDSLEDNLLSDELAEPDIAVEERAAVQASNESNPEDFEINEKGTLVKYKGAGGDVVIPYGVISIGEQVFKYSGGRLKSVTIPDSVTGIEKEAFCHCEGLESVVIPNSVVTIGVGAFAYCYSLESLTIPTSVIFIGNSAFSNCTSLKNVTIPDSVRTIGGYAFFRCESLTSMTIPASVNSIGAGAFGACNLLEEINVSQENTVYASSNGLLYSHDWKQLLAFPAGRNSVEIPNFVTSIGDSAFVCCYSLKSVTIPDNVTSIETCAFNGCVRLESVTLSNSITSISYGSFMDCALQSVNIPDGVTSIESEAFVNNFRLKSVTIPASVTSIAGMAFYGCSSLTIYGRKGSYAETYANGKGIPFVDPDAPTPAPTVTPIPESTVTPVPAPTVTPVPESTVTSAPTATVAPVPTQAPMTDLSNCKITVKAQVYTGKALKPAVKVVLNKKTLKKGTDYTITYENNKAIGTATVTVKGKGKYTGTAKATFKINPKAVTGLKLTADKGLINVRWKKPHGGIDGYELQYALKKNFKGGKKVTVKKASTLKATLKKLKKGKTYYVRIRAWKKVGKTTYWSAWSVAKKAKVK